MSYVNDEFSVACKRDSKSHGAKALEQSAKRDKKLAEQISALPRKMQKMLSIDASSLLSSSSGAGHGMPIKTKQGRRHPRDRGENTGKNLMDQYDETIYGEDDAQIETDKDNEEIRVRDEEREEQRIRVQELEQWASHGLTEQEYDAFQMYKINLDTIKRYCEDTEVNDPEYLGRLQADIRHYLINFDDERCRKFNIHPAWGSGRDRFPEAWNDKY